MSVDKITIKEAYLATYEFLSLLYDRTKSDELGSILGDLSLMSDGTTADPAALKDWIRCLEKVSRKEVDASFRII